MAKDVDTDGVGFGTFEFDEETQSDLMDNGEIGESAITVCVSSAKDAIQTEVKGSCNNSYWISSQVKRSFPWNHLFCKEGIG